ncbi:MAG TPA: hypothetical protein VG754_14495 [Verrucomicrobiae bacterium]|nr:hypothetical protein [Verrucomicrobiae bacterium]
MKTKSSNFWIFCIGAILVVICCRLIFLGTILADTTEYYDSKPLKDKSLPDWAGTNAIPLSPEKAVRKAIDYANSQKAHPVNWDVDAVELRRYSSDSAWFYTITLTDRKSGAYEFKVVRVLLNGEIWKPRNSK